MRRHLVCLLPTFFILHISQSLTYSFHFEPLSTCVNPKDFECSKNICISQSLVCNGKFDCPNKADEDDCGKFYFNNFVNFKNFN